jgi:GMP synthase-like glutamine amidotransferase
MAFAPMSPVGIFRNALTEGPGYFATYLDRQAIPWRLVKLDAGEAVPADPREFAGLVFMGGPMSVNDDLPWIAPVLRLIRDAVDADVPVLGHCLGGQLMSKALGGSVGRNPIKEIGWGEVAVLDSPAARQWFGHASKSFTSFHWHGETFTIPPGAERV